MTKQEKQLVREILKESRFNIEQTEQNLKLHLELSGNTASIENFKALKKYSDLIIEQNKNVKYL